VFLSNQGRKERAIRERVRARKSQLKRLGGACDWCGEEDWEVLIFDHRTPRGNPESQWKAAGSKILQEIKHLTTKKALEKFQILCCNCHAKKSRAEFAPYI